MPSRRAVLVVDDGPPLLVPASDDRTFQVWDAASGKALLTLQGHDDEDLSAAFSPDGARLVTAGKDRTARVFPITAEFYLRHYCPVALAINNGSTFSVPNDQGAEVYRACQPWVPAAGTP